MITISAPALALSETLLSALREANRIDGTMAYQSHAFGKIAEALVETIACGIADSQIIYFPEARTIANRLYEEALSNGENVDYQFRLWNDGIIAA